MKAIYRVIFAWLVLLSVSAQAGAIRNLAGFNANVYGGNDDGSYACVGPDYGVPYGCTPITVPIGFSLNFYGSTYSSLYVNNNGTVSFDGPMSDFTPFALTNSAIKTIAAFFADVDTRTGNVVTFGNDTVDGHQAFGVNWIGVGYYDQNLDKLNSFQIILINRSDRNAGDFDIEYNYDQVQWETGDASGGVGGLGGESVIVGYSDGTGRPGTSFQLNGSGIPGRLLDLNPGGLVHGSLNTNVPGRYVFPIINLPNMALGVTRLAQGDARWAANAYDNSGTNVQARGAAVTCLAMALNYSGITTDPGALNQLMINSNDFVGKNNVNWDAATRDASGETRQFHGYRTSDAQYLNQRLSQGYPVIVGVNLNTNRDPGHYVLVIGIQNGQYLIDDPGQANATMLSTYGNVFETRGYVGSSAGNISGLDLGVADAADILVVDPLGRLTGYDPTLTGVVEQIPQSAHFSDSLESSDLTGAPGTNTAKQVEIFQPMQGVYQVYLVGSNAGSYQLTLRGFSQSGTAESPLTLSGTRMSNAITAFQFNVGSASIASQSFTNEAPWTATPTNGNLPLGVHFTGPGADSGGNTLTNWYWSFGDGAFSTVKSPSHAYSSGGLFFPSLSAINNSGVGVFSFGPSVTVSNFFDGGLIQNGGFETGDFTGWTTSGDVSYSYVDSYFPLSGLYLAELGTSGSFGYLSQTLATTPGRVYGLSLWLNSSDTMANEFTVTWNGTNLVDDMNLGAIGWTNLQFKVTATGTATLLQLGFSDDYSYLGLDDVSVLPVSFRVVGFGLSGSNLVLNGNNPQTAGTYVTLVGTNLTQALSQWTPVATNVVGTSGDFSFTVSNTVSRNAPRRYYMLQMH